MIFRQEIFSRYFGYTCILYGDFGIQSVLDSQSDYNCQKLFANYSLHLCTRMANSANNMSPIPVDLSIVKIEPADSPAGLDGE